MNSSALLFLLSIATASSANEVCTSAPPFDDANKQPRPVIYAVMGIPTGVYFSELIAGIQSQASQKIGDSEAIEVRVRFSDGNETKQAELIEAASQSHDDGTTTVGILTVDGSAEKFCPVIDSILNDASKEIAIVSFDMDGDACSSNHVVTTQDDAGMATLPLEEAVSEFGQSLKVGYVSDMNYAPLKNRDEVWKTFKADNNWTQVFFVEDAAGFSSAEALQSAIQKAIDDNGMPIDFIYAPWDYLSVNTVKVLEDSNLTTETAVYGADINDEDISVMTAAGSPWKATAGGNPRAIGAALFRMVALAASGELEETQIKIPSTLVTQSFLLENDVNTLDDLDVAMPEILLPDFLQTCWIEPIGYDSLGGSQASSPQDVETASPTQKPTSAPTTSAKDDKASSATSLATFPLTLGLVLAPWLV
ncbi:hypothetical protein ACHAWF_005254 [Thalassiosira exigua]